MIQALSRYRLGWGCAVRLRLPNLKSSSASPLVQFMRHNTIAFLTLDNIPISSQMMIASELVRIPFLRITGGVPSTLLLRHATLPAELHLEAPYSIRQLGGPEFWHFLAAIKRRSKPLKRETWINIVYPKQTGLYERRTGMTEEELRTSDKVTFMEYIDQVQKAAKTHNIYFDVTYV
jgi:hypothetical protein